MVNIKSFPNNQDVYIGAEDVMRWHQGRSSGVFSAIRNLDVDIIEDSMSVEVSDGSGWLSDGNGHGIVFWNDTENQTGSKLVLTHDTAESTYDRIDRIVITWDLTDNYVSYPTISILKGTPSSNPKPPEITNNTSQRQISISQQKITAGSTSLLEKNKIDERLNPEVCGIVSDDVEIDTRGIQRQFDALLKSIENELSLIQGGTGFEPTPIRETNITISSSFFVEYEPSLENADMNFVLEEIKLHDNGYVYRAAVPVDNVISSMYPYLTFSLTDVEESGAEIINQFFCYDGGVYVYSKEVPSADITILTAEFRKAVS